MTNKRALEFAKQECAAYKRKIEDGYVFYQKVVDYYEIVIDVLEKQIPKKPNETDAYPHRVYCPNCYWTFWYNNENIIRDMYKYCPECGQAIDWNERVEDEEE